MMIYNDKTLLNEELVREGSAWVYPDYCRRDICGKWYVLSVNAHDVKKGLWADPNRVPPWEFRRKKRNR
jgi:endonuclease YncB( thermonuclease family)